AERPSCNRAPVDELAHGYPAVAADLSAGEPDAPPVPPRPLRGGGGKHSLTWLGDDAVSRASPQTSNTRRQPAVSRSDQRSSQAGGGSDQPSGRHECQSGTSQAPRDAPSLGVGETQRGEDDDGREGRDEEDR